MKQTTFHIEKVPRKAAETGGQLIRLMPNIARPSRKRGRLLASIIISKIYAASVWAEAIKKEVHRKRLLTLLRCESLRIVATYCTMPESTILVFSETPPIHLLVEDRQEIYGSRKVNKTAALLTKREAKNRVTQLWNKERHRESIGRWTFRIITELRRWLGRKNDEVGFYRAHTHTHSSGMEGFKQYLCRFKPKLDGICESCGEEDDVQHTLFKCKMQREERKAF